MDVDMIFKIAAIGILVAVLNQVLSRAGRDEQAMMTTLAGLVVVLMMVVQEIADLLLWSKPYFELWMEVMINVAAGAVTAVLCGTVVRRAAPELGFLLALAAGVWVLWTVADSLKLVTEWMKWLCELAGLEDWLVEPVFKTVVLSIITRLTAEVCKSAGENGVAAFVETAGTILALAVSLPLVGGVLKMMEGMLL